MKLGSKYDLLDTPLLTWNTNTFTEVNICKLLKNPMEALGAVDFTNCRISCRRLLTLFSISNCIIVFVWHNSSIRKHEYESITKITIQFDESLQSKLSSSELLLLHTSIVHVFWGPRHTRHLWFQTSFRPEDHTDWERGFWWGWRTVFGCGW